MDRGQQRARCACGITLGAESAYCHGCGAPRGGAAPGEAPLRGSSSGARCVRCGAGLLESAPACARCGHAASPGRARPGVAELDAWAAAPGGRALWVRERHDDVLRERLSVWGAVVRAPARRARIAGAALAGLTEGAERRRALGEAILLVEAAHRLHEHDLRALRELAAEGARVALRSPEAPPAALDVARAEGRACEPPATHGLSAEARQVLDALAVVDYRAEREVVAALAPLDERTLDACAGWIEVDGDALAFVDPDVADRLRATLPASERARLADAALAELAERGAALAERAELALDLEDDATALLLLDMRAREALAEEAPRAAIEALARGVERARAAPRDDATTRVAAALARTLAELLVREDRRAEAIDVIDDVMGWIRLGTEDLHTLALFRRALVGRLGRLDHGDLEPSLQARLACEAALHRAVDRSSGDAAREVRRAWSALPADQPLALSTVLLAERALGAVGRESPADAAELVDELLESRLARDRGAERLWRLRSRLAG